MATVSFRALSDKTLARYEAAEKAGTLTPRQASALRSHRGLPGAVAQMKAEADLIREIENCHAPPRRLELMICESTRLPGDLSLRTADGGMYGSIRRALTEAGFKAGDRVLVVPADGDKS